MDLRTFVDDWGLLFRDASAFDRIWTSLEQFTGQLDLAIDMSKTRVWSTDAAARKAFRSTAVSVTLAARNLGAHQNFSRHCHNAELQKRLSQMPKVWVRLRASPSPYRHKVAAIHMMAWPRALHGVTVVHVGELHFKPLRSGAVRALKADRKGTNPFLHLATSAFTSDPEAWSILQTLRDTRELGCPDQVEALLGLFSDDSLVLPANGPTAILVSRLRRVGWAIGGQGLLQDRFGIFSLMHVAWDELLLRLKLSWGHVLSHELTHRSTFFGLAQVDLPELHRVLRTFGAVDQVYLRCHLDGTLFVQNGRAKFQANTSSQCPWCPAKDGFHHRAWVCPYFAPCRTHVTPEQWAVLPTLPACLVDHGWPILLPEWEVVVGFLLREDGLSKMSPVVPPVHSRQERVELFLDGTCAFPQDARLRYAAWAITIATGGVGAKDNQLLQGGHVRGFSQSPFRAEATAAMYAIRWAIQNKQPVRLWCDCQGVVKGVRRLLSGKGVRRNAPHSDLWWSMQDDLQGGAHLVQIYKVVSHGAQNQATGPLEDWVYWHNALTDTAAEHINQRRSAEFWAAWEGLQSAQAFHRKLHSAILRVLVQTSRMATAAQQKPSATQVQVPEAPVPRLPAQWEVSPALTRRYGQVNMDHLHSWWMARGIAMMQGPYPFAFISGIQLFLAFSCYTGYQGPWCFRKRWYSCAEDVPVAGRRQWGDRCKGFLLLWKNYLKCNGVTIGSKMARLKSAAVSKWGVCYRLRWSPALVDEIDQIVFHQLGRQAATPADISSLRAVQ